MSFVMWLVALALTPPVATAGTPGCATHGEYDQLETFMRTFTVADLFDTNGTFLGENEQVFRRGYDTCWDPSKIVVVRYDQVSGYSVSWLVREDDDKKPFTHSH